VDSALILADMIGGRYRRGVYRGQINQLRFLARIESGGYVHSWVEKDDTIYDPTWWAFTRAPVGIYKWPTSDDRYVCGRQAKNRTTLLSYKYMD
jgi:hypothetical protein